MESGTTDTKENGQPELKRRFSVNECSEDNKQPKLSKIGVIETNETENNFSQSLESQEIESEEILSQETASQDTASQETASQETESQDSNNAAESDNFIRESDTDSDDSKTEKWASCNNPRTMLAFLQTEMNTGKDPYEIMEEVIGPAMTANIKNRYTQGGLNPYDTEDADIRPWKLRECWSTRGKS